MYRSRRESRWKGALVWGTKDSGTIHLEGEAKANFISKGDKERDSEGELLSLKKARRDSELRTGELKQSQWLRSCPL